MGKIKQENKKKDKTKKIKIKEIRKVKQKEGKFHFFAQKTARRE